jgi:hypothetical protein
MGANERAKWLKRTDGTFVTERDVLCVGGTYKIPNVMAVYTSKSGWGDGLIMYVTHLKRRATADGNRYRSKNYKVVVKTWAASEDDFINLWKMDGIYAISFAGHGSKYGFIADKDSGSAVNPSEVFPPYQLQAVRAYSCRSDAAKPGNAMLPDGTTPTYRWKSHIAPGGSYVGLTGLANRVSQFWQEESVNADVVPD